MAAADAIGFEKQIDERVEVAAIEGDGKAFFKAYGNLFALDFNIVAPRGHTHDGGNYFYRSRQMFQVFCFVGCTEDVGVGGVGLFGGHLVGEAGLLHERGHLGASA